MRLLHDVLEMLGEIGIDRFRRHEQDREILKIQQDSLIRTGFPKGVDITADSGGIQARRILAQLIANQEKAASP